MRLLLRGNHYTYFALQTIDKHETNTTLEAKMPAEAEASGWHFRNTLVPTARLELAQLSPLPPQDSVSTNFTTSALHAIREDNLC
jgi:hypothetical protein